MNEDSLTKSEGDAEDNLSKCDDGLLQTTEFAELCSFIHHFGTELGIYLTFPQLEQFLSLENDANWKNWETLHIKLLNKLKYRAKPEKWEPVLGRFIFNHAANIDGLPEAAECLVSGVCNKASQLQSTPVHITRPYSPVYYGLGVEVRTRLLLTLLESQFDRNQSFKDKVNLRSAVDLRFRPLGYDVWGRIYWLLKDSEINVLLYREDSERRAFQLVCRSTEEMRTVCTQLENACPASSKLSDILKSGADGVIGTEKAGSFPLSLDTTLQKLVEDGIASTEADSAVHLDPETAFINGKEHSNLDQSPDSVRSPHRVAQNGLKNPYQPDDVSPLLEIKAEPYLEKSQGSAKSAEEMLQNSDSSLKGDLISIKPKLESDKLADSATVMELNSGSCDKTDKDQDDAKVEVKSESRENPSEENLANHRVPAKLKSRKRGRRPKTACHQQIDGSIVESAPAVEVRRSGRVRKPVEFLTIEVPQPKRLRQAAKPTEPVVNGLADQPKKKRCSALVVASKKKKKKKRKHKRRHAKKSKSSNPWLNATSSSESDEDDTFERALREHEETIYDSDAADANRNKPDALDWIDKPESDFNPDELDNQSDVDSLTQGRNFARQKRLERMRIDHTTALTSNAYVDETCQVCGKAHDPEWILLCDRCDRGHHAMCLCPPLFVIPEGDWFCPRCQHATLLQALTECADQIDAEQKKQTIWKRMQERLNFVNISMTNILAEDDEGEENGRKRRGRPSTQIVYQDSDSSPADQGDDGNATGQDSDKSDSPFLANDSETGSEFGGRRTISRRRSALNPRVSAKHRVHRAAPRRGPTRWLSESEDESTSASSDVSFESPAPRAARQRPVQYDLGEAFRQLDEALEDDEKYQEEKRRRRSKKSSYKNEVDDPDKHNCSGSPSSGSPTGHSRGKDLSNIMGPDWEEQLDLDRPGRSRKRRVGILSSSSADSDDDKLPTSSNRKKRKGSSDDADDVDFQPSGTSEEFSDQSDDEDRDGVDSTFDSDTSWLSAPRRRKRGTGIKSLQSSRKRPKYSSRRRSRPVPRFEQSEDEVSLSDGESSHKDCSRLRPRRCARAVVSYRESDEQDENNSNGTADDFNSKTHTVKSANRRRLASSTDEDTSPENQKNRASSTGASKVDRSPTPLSKRSKTNAAHASTRRRHILSSSESEYQPDHSDGEEDEERDSVDDQVNEISVGEPKHADTAVDLPAEIEETSFESHRVDESYVFDHPGDETLAPKSEGSSQTELRITESSPEPPSPSVIPMKESIMPPKCLQVEHSQDEESVEEDAEDLLPRHPFPSHLPSNETSSNQTNKVAVSPDLFT